MLAEESIAFYIDSSGGLWWANGNSRLEAPKAELSIHPQGSLAFLLRSLDAGPGGTAAHGALSLAPDFRLTIYRALQTHLPRSSAALDSQAFLTFSILSPANRLTLAKASTPNPALPDQNEPIPSPLSLPTPPHRTPVVRLRHALSHFPIDDSWIRPGGGPGCQYRGSW